MPTLLYRECLRIIADLRALADALEAELRRTDADKPDRQDRPTR